MELLGITKMLGLERSYNLAGKTQPLLLRCVYINDVERA